VTLRAHPLRDGRTGGSFISITLADGQTMKSVPRSAATSTATTGKPATPGP